MMIQIEKKPAKMTKYHDPWAKYHDWRNHPVFQRKNQMKNMFPGLGIASVAFAGYCIVEYLYNKHHVK